MDEKWCSPTPEEAAVLFSRAAVPWWFAGGWAIDLRIRRAAKEILAASDATSRARTSSSRARSLLRMTHTTADNPPSTWSSTPVMNDAAGDARKSTAAATSAASP